MLLPHPDEDDDDLDDIDPSLNPKIEDILNRIVMHQTLSSDYNQSALKNLEQILSAQTYLRQKNERIMSGVKQKLDQRYLLGSEESSVDSRSG